MKKLRHSKYKNTGFLFEIMVRQITSDIIGGKKKSISERLLAKYFNKSTELGKENSLYQILIKERTTDERKADRILDTVIDARRKLSESKLREEKFELVKEIKEYYNVDDFFRSECPNYKVLASVWKVFENAVSSELYNPSVVSEAKDTIIESVLTTASTKNIDPFIDYFKGQDQRTRKLSYKILIENFNKKYSGLSTEQRMLLKEYILNVSNTNSLRETTNRFADSAINKLTSFLYNIDDSVTRIKLKETIKQLDNVKSGKLVKESQLSALMLTYELISEIENVTKVQ